ncbi:MAG: nucleotide disphospho-sugar-binding domain-containing protein [Rhodococcus sp. (in: high G+C Gram-positive bacteria)]
MKLTLAFHGSRGDVQPGIALGVELVSRGHDIVLAVPPNLVEFAGRSGLEAGAVGVDTAELLRSSVVQRDMASRNPRRRLAAITSMSVDGGRIMRQQLLEMSADADAIVGSSVGQESSLDVADRLGAAYVPVHFCPVRRNGVASILPLPAVSPPWVRRTGWDAVDLTLHLASRHAHGAMRSELGLEPLTTSVAAHLARSATTEIQAYDSALFPGLADEWGDRRPLVGFLGPHRTTLRALDPAPASLSEHVRAFLASGPPPVYVGFGSMTVPRGPALVNAIVGALRRAGRRILLSTGWGDIGSRSAPDLATVGSVDHAALFPLCEAVIHHGGAGTTAAGLRAGKPTLVCHVGADQPLWGRAVTAAGVGASVSARSADAPTIDAALSVVLRPQTRVAASTLGRSMITPADAVGQCADLVERIAYRTSTRSESLRHV